MSLYLNKQSYLYFRTYREHQANQSGLVEKLVSGKLGKQQFIDQEGAIVKKKESKMGKNREKNYLFLFCSHFFRI